MIIEIDFNSEEAIYIQLRNQIIIGIAQEEIKGGESLPSVRQMAEQIGVNMHTVNKAYATLRSDGYLTLDRRNGAVICMNADKTRHLEFMCEGVRMMVAEAICKEITLDEFHQIVTQKYQEFLDSHNGGRP